MRYKAKNQGFLGGQRHRLRRLRWQLLWLVTIGVWFACNAPPATLPTEFMGFESGTIGSPDAADAMPPREPSPEPTGPDTSQPEFIIEQQKEPALDAVAPEPRPEPIPESGPERTKESSSPAPSSCPPSTTAPVDGIKQWLPLTLNTSAPKLHTLPACGAIGFRIVAPAKMELQVDIAQLPLQGEFALEVFNARRINKVAQDPPLASGKSIMKPYISLKFQVPISGEQGIVLSAPKVRQQTPFAIQVFCTKNCQLEATRFPIVLMHGFAGTDKYFGLLDYFYQVKPDLEKRGYAVFTPKVQPIADSTQRVLRLKKQIDDIFKKTGARKLNLIAHSQGGVDGRLLISLHKYGDRIASLTTISTPHRGIPVPNLLIPPSQELGEDNMKKYNALYPNDPRVKYFSWAGVSCAVFDKACRKKYKDETVDPLLWATYKALKAMRGPNDGLVPLSSAKWGTFLGELPADHWDEIGQIADKNNKAFHHKQFYLNEARRLRRLDF